MRTKPWMFLCGALSGGLMCGSVHAQTVVEDFEYATDDDLRAVWLPSANAAVTVSEAVAPTSPGQKAMRVEFNFPSAAWATESVNGVDLASPLSIDPAQYVTLRIKGDPAFAGADFRTFYVYAYDADGNFGRWGAPVPTTADWQTLNFSAGGVEKPWNSPALPDLSRIVRFAFYQYGSQAAIPAYSATIALDDLVIRETPVTNPVVPTEYVIEAFEYADDAALRAAWTPSPNALLTLSGAVAPLSLGQNALRVQFNFPSGEWATESVRGPDLAAPVAIAATQYVTLRIKGDPAFADADFRTFFLYAYDGSGNFGRWGTPVPTNAAWQILNFSAGSLAKPWDSPALPDLSRIVRFALFQYGSQAAIPAYTATLEVDDLQVRHTPLIDVATTESVVEVFEDATDEALLARWTASAHAALALTESVAPHSTGQKALSMTFNFPSIEWATEWARGPLIQPALVLGPKQYLSLRIQGDPAFEAADFRNFYVYVYDSSGNFGRWGAPVPTDATWQILNFSVGTIQKPWDSPGLPDLGRIVRLAFFQYGSQAALPEYTATVRVDDVMVRDTPLDDAPVAPVLTAVREGNALKLTASRLGIGKVYELRTSADLTQWTSDAGSTATADTYTWTVALTGQAGFFRVAEKTR